MSKNGNSNVPEEEEKVSTPEVPVSAKEDEVSTTISHAMASTPTAPAPEYPELTKDTLRNLEDKVRLRISAIGIGNAGSQIAAALYKEDKEVFIINSSLRDLSDDVISSHIPSFIIGNEARGAGKNRMKAKELLKINGKQLFSIPQFIDMVEHSDIIFICASSAGGSGSGIAPDLAGWLAKMYPHKIIIPYGIIPKLSDSIIAQNNTLQFMDEIEKLKVPYMIADLAHYEDSPNDVAYTAIANHIVTTIDIISGKYLNHSNNGMIDENDMRVIVGEPGYMAAYCLNNITPAMVDKKSIQSYIIDLIKNSPAASIQRDKIVKQMGVIVNCPDSIMESAKSGNYNELCEYIGVPLAIFENYSVNEKALGQFIVLLSGMNLPYSRILQAKQKIEEHEEAIKKVKPIDLSPDVDRFAFLNNRDTTKLVDASQAPVDEGKKKSVLDDFFG